MKGFKGTNADMTCRDFQFELETEFAHPSEIKPCESGFHFCQKLDDVFCYYNNPDDRIFEIEATGDVIDEGHKSVTNKIKFVRELPIEEIYKQCQHRWAARRMAAHRQYKLDILINDPDEFVRRQVAKQRYGLDLLVKDPSPGVRREVAKHGYGLEVLIKDEDWAVRQEVARQGYGLDVLINDPCVSVRYAAHRAKG